MRLRTFFESSNEDIHDIRNNYENLDSPISGYIQLPIYENIAYIPVWGINTLSNYLLAITRSNQEYNQDHLNDRVTRLVVAVKNNNNGTSNYTSLSTYINHVGSWSGINNMFRIHITDKTSSSDFSYCKGMLRDYDGKVLLYARYKVDLISKTTTPELLLDNDLFSRSITKRFATSIIKEVQTGMNFLQLNSIPIFMNGFDKINRINVVITDLSKIITFTKSSTIAPPFKNPIRLIDVIDPYKYVLNFGNNFAGVSVYHD